MKKALLVALGLGFVCLLATDANAINNDNAKWALHYAGVHNSKTNTCAKVFTDCTTEVLENGPSGPGRFDIYVVALDTDGIAGSRYGLECPEGGFFFYGWTKCSDFEIPTSGWPGCGEANAQTWSMEKPAGHTPLGILDTYVYAGVAKMCVGVDLRVGFAEFCDGSQPSPICFSTAGAAHFGCVGFGMPGYNPCGEVATEQRSWGAVKSLYR